MREIGVDDLVVSRARVKTPNKPHSGQLSFDELQAVLRRRVRGELPEQTVARFRLDALHWSIQTVGRSNHQVYAGTANEGATLDAAEATLDFGISDEPRFAAVGKDSRNSKRVLAVSFTREDLRAYGIDVSVAIPEVPEAYMDLGRVDLSKYEITRLPTREEAPFCTEGYVTEEMVRQTSRSGDNRHQYALRFNDSQREGDVTRMQLRRLFYRVPGYDLSRLGDNVRVTFMGPSVSWHMDTPGALRRVYRAAR